MRADWFISPFDQRCGGCGVAIAKGAPRRRVRVGGVRCVECAKRNFDEDAPDDLPETPAPCEPSGPPLPPSPFRRWLPDVDFKQRQGHDE